MQTAAVKRLRAKGPAASTLTGLFLDRETDRLTLLLDGRGLAVGPLPAHDLAELGLALLRRAMEIDANGGDQAAAAAAAALDRIAAAGRPYKVN